MNEDEILRDFLLRTPSKITEPEEISDEEYKKRLEFLLESHECSGAKNAKTWLGPGRQLWLIFKDEPERCTWITYCPYCGYKPEDKKKWW
jgi:hypothetical protein